MRVRRVEESVREELASLLGTGVKDPRAAGAIVTRVEMSDDLRGARVHVRLLEGGDDEARRREVVDALRRGAGMLRREVTQRLRLALRSRAQVPVRRRGRPRDERRALLAEIDAEKKS